MVTPPQYFASTSSAGAAGPSAHPEAGQLPDDDAIQEAALELLASADLNVLTEAGLRALLSEKFKADLSAKQAFLKRVVKDFISNEVAKAKAAQAAEPTQVDRDKAIQYVKILLARHAAYKCHVTEHALEAAAADEVDKVVTAAGGYHSRAAKKALKRRCRDLGASI